MMCPEAERIHDKTLAYVLLAISNRLMQNSGVSTYSSSMSHGRMYMYSGSSHKQQNKVCLNGDNLWQVHLRGKVLPTQTVTISMRTHDAEMSCGHGKFKQSFLAWDGGCRCFPSMNSACPCIAEFTREGFQHDCPLSGAYSLWETSIFISKSIAQPFQVIQAIRYTSP